MLRTSGGNAELTAPQRLNQIAAIQRMERGNSVSCATVPPALITIGKAGNGAITSAADSPRDQLSDCQARLRHWARQLLEDRVEILIPEVFHE
jgi:hypothetical protein